MVKRQLPLNQFPKDKSRTWPRLKLSVALIRVDKVTDELFRAVPKKPREYLPWLGRYKSTNL
jgi:hypothetical protein